MLALIDTVVHCWGLAAYNLYFHPLNKFREPVWASASSVRLIYAFARGRVSFWIEVLYNNIKVSIKDVNMTESWLAYQGRLSDWPTF